MCYSHVRVVLGSLCVQRRLQCGKLVVGKKCATNSLGDGMVRIRYVSLK